MMHTSLNIPASIPLPIFAGGATFLRTGRTFFSRAAVCSGVIALMLAMGLSPSAHAGTLSPEEQELANFLAGDRGQQRSRSRMSLDPILTAVARSRAEDMARRHYFSHTDPDGYGPNFMVRAGGYTLPRSWGGGRSDNYIESIGAGHSTPAAAWEGWMRSPVHRAHLLAQSSFYRDQTNFGVGFHSDPTSPYRRYWVIITAPPERAATFTTRGSAKAIRISAAVPTRLIELEEETAVAPRPTLSQPAGSPGKLWNWTEPTPAPRPAVRGSGSG